MVKRAKIHTQITVDSYCLVTQIREDTIISGLIAFIYLDIYNIEYYIPNKVINATYKI